jgi:hypothetical protein
MASDSSATRIGALDNSYPDGGVDPMSVVDNQLQMLKNVLQGHFPNFTTVQVTATEKQINNVAFAIGVDVLFYEVSAPTGWTESSVQAGSGLRAVAAGGTGGTPGNASGSDFNTVMNLSHVHTVGTLDVGDTTLTAAQSGLPAHTHAVTPSGVKGLAGTGPSTTTSSGQTQSTIGVAANAAQDASASHTHSISGVVASASVNFSFKYMDVIVCHPTAVA